jgi:hypothetical protein
MLICLNLIDYYQMIYLFDRLLFISFIIVVKFCTGKYVVDDNLTQNTNQYLHLQHQAYLDAWVFKNVS